MENSSFRVLLTLIYLLFSTVLVGLEPPENLVGKDLRDWFRINYYQSKRIYLNYNEARIFMYGFIDNRDGSLECVYSGYRILLPYGTKTTFPDPINCEHTIPQSYFKIAGEKEMMKTDLHHLFPVLKRWNSTRSNHPYSEIDDSLTTKWMTRDIDTKSIPLEEIDSYSEYFNRSFEPREEHKGNVARAIFYFYTVYNHENVVSMEDLIDVEILLTWHVVDPVDDAEKSRNDKIERYQGNRNPYIDFPESAIRAFYP